MRGILQSSKMWDSMILDFFHGWKKHVPTVTSVFLRLEISQI